MPADLDRDLMLARLYEPTVPWEHVAALLVFDATFMRSTFLGAPMPRLDMPRALRWLHVRDEQRIRTTARAALRQMQRDGYAVPALRREIAQQLRWSRRRLGPDEIEPFERI